MRTLITLDNSNCPRCHNAMVDTLRSTEGVRRVESNFTVGCLVIDHDGDLRALVSSITAVDRGIAVASNGEREMVSVGGHEAHACHSPDHIVRAHPENGRSPMGSAGTASHNSTRPFTASCPVCRPDGPIGAGGVRILTRRHAAPGVVLRAARVVVRVYRVVFRLPGADR